MTSVIEAPPRPEDGGAVILHRERARARAKDLCAFIDTSPMPYQAVDECVLRLVDAGYEPLREGDAWQLRPGGRYFVHRNASTLVAFRVGAEAPSSTGIAAFGAHLDSPNLRVKPIAETNSVGYRQLAVDVYGGALLATWTDRDLGLAGRVSIAAKGALRDSVESLNVVIQRPIARISNVAIHLNRGVNDEGLTLNKQRDLPPVLGLDDTSEGEEWCVRSLVAAELGIEPGAILSYDLGLFDVVPSTLGGVNEEFVYAPRLDNLGSSHAGLEALIAASQDAPQPPQRSWLIALFDHEECGSTSQQGAQGTFVLEVARRLASGHPDATGRPDEESSRAIARSFLVSADMAHAVHPNRPDLHEPAHMPRMNRGPVLKRNDNQRYATDAESAGVFKRLCAEAGFAPQDFVTRSDMPCGSTIGALSAANTGMKTVDVGNPMLSMHSVREVAGTWDHDLMIEAVRRLFV